MGRGRVGEERRERQAGGLRLVVMGGLKGRADSTGGAGREPAKKGVAWRREREVEEEGKGKGAD